MKFICIFLAVVTSTLSLCGQSIEVQVGPVIDFEQIQSKLKVPKSTLLTPFKSFSYSSSMFFDPELRRAYYGYGYQDNAFHFGAFDNYLGFFGLQKLTADNLNEQTILNAFLSLNKKMYVLYTIKNAKQDQFTVYANELSKEFSLSGSPVVVHSFTELKSYGATLHVSTSADKRFILLTRALDAKPREAQKLDCKMIDGTFSEVWAKLIETTIVGGEHTIRSVNVDDSGNMYTLIEYQNGRDPKPIVFAYYWQANSFKAFEPGLSAGVNFGVRMEVLHGHEPYLVGLNEKAKGKGVEIKYFIDRINATSKVMEKLGSGEMSADFRKVSNANLFDMRQWNVMNIIPGANGIVASVEAVVMEDKYGVQHSFNAFVFSFRKDGSAIWTRTIHKKQSAMPGMAGHLLTSAGDRVLFIYNDDAGNAAKLPDDDEIALFTSNNAMAMVQEIDASGAVQKYQLTKSPELEGFALNFNAMGKVEPGFYADTAIKINGRKSVASRNLTLQIK